MPIRNTRNLWTIIVALGYLATPVRAQEANAEAILSETADSPPTLASAPGGGVFVAWSESTPGVPPHFVLRARRLDAALAQELDFKIVDGRDMPETYFQCPVVARVGADRLAFAWLASTVAGRRVALRVTTTAGVPVGPVRFAERPMPNRLAFCPHIGGWARGFTITWPSGKAPNSVSFRARSFDEAGAPVSPQLELQRETDADPFPPGLAVDGRGHFTVAWLVFERSGQLPARLRMRRFLRNGIPTAGIVEVAGNVRDSAALASFGRGADEGVEIAWASLRTDGRATVRVQRFDRQLRPLGPARPVANTRLFGWPALRIDAESRSAMIWEPAGSRSSGIFLDAALAPCSSTFPVQRDRAVSAANLAFSTPDEVAIGLLEQGADHVRRLVVRTFSLSECPDAATP